VSFLLDTDTCSAEIKGNNAVSNRFIQYSGRLHISTVTLAELHVWALRAHVSRKRMVSVSNLLKQVRVLCVDEAVAYRFGVARAWQLDHGCPSPDLDLLNAAVALAHGLTLVTHNTADYDNIPLLAKVDWLVP
jgi:tRNA(fMet)-specific endonuclease VapC